MKLIIGFMLYKISQINELIGGEVSNGWRLVIAVVVITTLIFTVKAISNAIGPISL